MPEWRSPHDPWPTHPRGSANEALKNARAHGWWLKPASARGHSFGRIVCQRLSGDERLDDDAACDLRVYSTPRGGTDTTAKIINKRVRNCPHEPPAPEGDPEQRLAEEKVRVAVRRLQWVDAAIAAFEKLEQAEAAAERREELLEVMIDCRDDMVEAYQEAAEAAESEVVELHGQAREHAEEADLGSEPWPPEQPVARLLDPAEGYLEIVVSMIEGRAGEAVERLRVVVEQRCERVRELRDGHSDRPSEGA